MLVQRLEHGGVAAAVVHGEREEHPADGGDVVEGVLERPCLLTDRSVHRGSEYWFSL